MFIKRVPPFPELIVFSLVRQPVFLVECLAQTAGLESLRCLDGIVVPPSEEVVVDGFVLDSKDHGFCHHFLVQSYSAQVRVWWEKPEKRLCDQRYTVHQQNYRLSEHKVATSGMKVVPSINNMICLSK